MSKHSILLVDDEASILDSLGEGLRQAGYAVTEAASGEEAVSKLRSQRFDLVVTDLMMPGISGIELLKEAKNIQPKISVIILTGYGDMNSAIAALRLGADDYLLKPHGLEELFMRIKRCLEKQELQTKVNFYEEILPVCMYCHKIRDDTDTKAGEGEWMSLGEYLHRTSDTNVTHCCCPECFHKHEND